MTVDTFNRSDIQEMADSVLTKESSSERRRAALERGADVGLDRVVAELGWSGIAIPSDLGGIGAGIGDLGTILVEMGRHAAVGSLGASALVGSMVLLHAQEPSRSELLGRMAEGTATATVGLSGASGQPAPDGLTMRAERRPGRWRLRGRASFVPFADTADAIVVLADDGSSVRGFVVHPGEDVAVAVQSTWDLTRRFATVELHDLDLPDDRELTIEGDDLVRLVLNAASYWLACDSLGLSLRLVDATAAYGAERVQFDRPIGSFQAWKHYAADMLISAEAARGAVGAAHVAFDSTEGLPSPEWTGPSTTRATAAALLVAADAAVFVGSWATQLHGGIAYTWEHDTHLYLKRAKLNQLLLGSPDRSRDRVMASLTTA